MITKILLAILITYICTTAWNLFLCPYLFGAAEFTISGKDGKHRTYYFSLRHKQKEDQDDS